MSIKIVHNHYYFVRLAAICGQLSHMHIWCNSFSFVAQQLLYIVRPSHLGYSAKQKALTHGQRGKNPDFAVVHFLSAFSVDSVHFSDFV